MQIVLPYGNHSLSTHLPWGQCLGVLDIADAEALPDVPAGLRAALAHPIGLEHPLCAGFRPGESVTIIVSDAFRHTGVERLLPALLDEIHRHGIQNSDIHFLFATGSHRSPSHEEQSRILGTAVYERFHTRAVTHNPYDAENLVPVGTTSRGTPVKIHRLASESDHVLATGTVVLHYFGGFGGGRKSIVPGIAGMETIARNHALNLHPTEDRLNPAVRIGALDGNPVAEDMLEAAQLCKLDGIVNTVLNRHGNIVGIYAGELDAAHRAAARHAQSLCAVEITQQADLVIASAGGAKNFVQSHKALFNAFQAMRPGGRIVFLARCPEGIGGNKIQQWLSLRTRDAIIAELRRNAEINGQTALSTVEKASSAFMLTELTEKETALMGARKAATLGEALIGARQELLEAGIADPTYYVMPSASYTVPFLRASECSEM